MFPPSEIGINFLVLVSRRFFQVTSENRVSVKAIALPHLAFCSSKEQFVWLSVILLNMEDGRDLVQLFVSIGLSEIKAKETLKNANVSAHLKNCIDSVMPALFYCFFFFSLNNVKI